MLHPSSPPWHPTRLHNYRAMRFATAHEAARALLDAYRSAQMIPWTKLVQFRHKIPKGQPGPFTSELAVIIAPNAYIVHQVLNGWPGDHVVSIRWPAPWEALLVELDHAA